MDLHVHDDDGNDDGELETWEGSMMNFVAVKKKNNFSNKEEIS